LHCSWVEGRCNTDSTPILISLDNNGDLDMVSAEEGVWFDIFADGRPVKLSWTRTGADVGFLVMDRNSNAQVDDASELFGNYTRKADGTRAANGFEALEDLDGGSLQSDGKIDSSDPVYNALRLWFDRDHNGRSSQAELVPLPVAGVLEIRTEFRERRRMDSVWNKYRYEGDVVVLIDGREKMRRVFDVILRRLPARP
jgi:hypothetical protein